MSAPRHHLRDSDISDQHAAGCRIVVCDDVEDYRALLVQLLEREPSIQVVGEAQNGREAIDLASSHQPDVVLLDMSMPVMDGMEALPLIRTAAPNSKVLILTGFANTDIRAQALAGGAVGYIVKGTRPEQLVGAVMSACAG